MPHGQADRVAAGDVAVLLAAVDLVLRLVEAVNQVMGAATRRSGPSADVVGPAGGGAGGGGGRDGIVDPPGFVGEGAVHRLRCGGGTLPRRVGGVGAGSGQRGRRGEVDVILVEADQRAAVLGELGGRCRGGIGQPVDVLAADLAPSTVEVVEAVVFLVDHHDVLDLG